MCLECDWKYYQTNQNFRNLTRIIDHHDNITTPKNTPNPTSSNQNKPNQQNHEDPFDKVTPVAEQNNLFIKEVEYAMKFLQQIADYMLSPE